MQVLSRYDVRREIGRGGMGVVLEAYDQRLGRRVALKVLSQAGHEPDRRARFEREARAASALNHPNIVTVHDVVSAGADDYIVMEYVDGVPLSAEIAAGRMPVSTALRYAEQIGAALAAAHAAGIVHRDLKPANIMVGRDGRIKVVDFGLSKLLQRDAPPDADTATRAQLTRSGVVAGTSGYMSPEQASGDAVDARSDVFSFGIVLYEMLAGRRAFTGDSYTALLSALLHREPEPLGRVRPDIPTDVTRLVARCLAKDPARRFASGADVHAALAAMANDATAAQHGRRDLRRWVALIALVLIAAPALPLYRSYTTRVRAEALLEIERDMDRGRYGAAYARASGLARSDPGDDAVQRTMQKLTYASELRTDPPGAIIQFRDYDEPEAPWYTLGVSPIGDRPPVGALHWRIAKDGYDTVEGGFWWGAARLPPRLHPVGTRPEGMVHVPGGRLADTGAPALGEFWVGRHEVTNAAFKRFVDAGGYRDQKWWRHPVAREGRTLSWADAMRLFVDRTGRPGPSTWEGGSFPDSEANHPVAGVSWYEAAAFAEFSGMSLPTVFQWQLAAGPQNMRRDVRIANFGPRPVPVSSLRDLGAYGTYGMAGNVKEWAWNAVDGQRYILGGSWNEPLYMSTQPDARPPLDRAPTNGIRLLKHITPPASELLADVRILPAHFPPRTPVSDEVFDAYRRFYAYDRTPLDPKPLSSSETADWKEQHVSIAAAYGNERLPITMLVPKNAAPPYQAVVWCPGSYSVFFDASERMTLSYYFDFVVKSGRLLVMPDFQGMWSRRQENPGGAQAPETDAFRNRVIQSAKDLSRTIDYLETRPDVDATKVAFYVFSVGGALLALPGMEPRVSGAVLVSAGLPRRPFPPEIDPVNIAPRMRMPVLLLGGRYDFLTPVDAAQKPLFERIGTPVARKKHVIFESGHVPERIAVIREVLGWLDATLGPVRAN